jgi:diguanylate cyclase (GGDEF)-like protein
MSAAETDPARDALTGLLSYDALVDECRNAVEAANGGEAVGLLYLSFDGLRELNAKSGNLVTDKVLRELARRLRAVVRECDYAGRLNRDEFVVILRQLSNRLATLTLVQRVRMSLAEPIGSGKEAYVPALNFGMAHPPADGTTLEALAAVAEKAMLDERDKARTAAKDKALQRVAETRAAANAALAHITECELAVRDADSRLIESKRLYGEAKAAVAAAIEAAKGLGITIDVTAG